MGHTVCLRPGSDAYHTDHGFGSSARAHVQCTPVFRVSGTAGRTALIFGAVFGVGLLFRHQLGTLLTQIRDGVHLHVCTCAVLVHVRISGTAGRIALNVDMLVEEPASYACCTVTQVMDELPLSGRAHSFSISREGLDMFC